MQVLIALTVGLVIWIAGWAFGAKAFDTFLIAMALVLVAITMRIVQPYIDKLLKP
jgi:hypothetical protein